MSALPTATELVAMQLPDRTRAFGAWLRAQPRDDTYVYDSHVDCALGRFAQAVFGVPGAKGGICDISNGFGDDRRVHIELFRYGYGIGLTLALIPSGSAHRKSFGAASDAFDAAMRQNGISLVPEVPVPAPTVSEATSSS